MEDKGAAQVESAERRSSTPMSDDVGPVLLDPRVLEQFLEPALASYRDSWGREGPLRLPRAWGLLLGRFEGNAVRVDEVRFAENVRETDPIVLDEFRDSVVPRFGSCYSNGDRGFWCSAVDLMAIDREASARGLTLLGSIHMHGDLHRPGERQSLSERPTPMDEYMFRNTGWPLNLICYLESRGEQVFHALGAWAPPSPDDAAHAKAIPMRIATTPRRR